MGPDAGVYRAKAWCRAALARPAKAPASQEIKTNQAAMRSEGYGLGDDFGSACATRAVLLPWSLSLEPEVRFARPLTRRETPRRLSWRVGTTPWSISRKRIAKPTSWAGRSAGWRSSQPSLSSGFAGFDPVFPRLPAADPKVPKANNSTPGGRLPRTKPQSTGFGLLLKDGAAGLAQIRLVPLQARDNGPDAGDFAGAEAVDIGGARFALLWRTQGKGGAG